MLHKTLVFAANLTSDTFVETLHGFDNELSEYTDRGFKIRNEHIASHVTTSGTIAIHIISLEYQEQE